MNQPSHTGIGIASDRLGPLISSHPPNRSNAARAQSASRYVRWFARAVIMYAAYLALERSSWMVFFSFGAMGFVLEVLGWLVGHGSRQASFLNVEIYAQGVRSETKSGVDEIRWTDIQAVIVDSSVHRSGWGEFEIRITKDDGTTTELKIPTAQVRDSWQLFKHLLDGTGKTVRALTREAWAAGAALDFGPIIAEAEGLRVDGELRPWGRVGTFRLADGWLRAESEEGPWFHSRIKNMTNVAGLLEVLSDRVQPKPGPNDWTWEWGD